MSSRLSKYRKILSFAVAFKLYRHVKLAKGCFFKLSILKHPVFLRGIISDEKIFEQIFIDKNYEIEFPFKPTNVIDLGANVGYASVFFANKYPDAKIFAVEPEFNNHNIAKQNLGFYNNVQLVQGGVWYKESDLKLVDNGFGEAAFMIEENQSGTNSVKAYTIPVIMKLMEIEMIDVLKMDIEGTEKEMFENGYEEWLPKTKMVIVETHDRDKKGTSKAVFNAFSKYDFSLELSGENLVLYNNKLV